MEQETYTCRNNNCGFECSSAFALQTHFGDSHCQTNYETDLESSDTEGVKHNRRLPATKANVRFLGSLEGEEPTIIRRSEADGLFHCHCSEYTSENPGGIRQHAKIHAKEYSTAGEQVQILEVLDFQYPQNIID
jgi:hypothetical protein